MAARRARIKPVISLPPRRKKYDGNDTKTKTFVKETIENPDQSPQTPLDTITTQDYLDRRSPRPSSPIKSPLPVTNVLKYQGEKVPSPLAQTEATKEVSVIPKATEKVGVNSDNNMFVSPRNVASPLIVHVVSPLVQTSGAEVNVQRFPTVTPAKVPEMHIQKYREIRPAKALFTYGRSKKAKKNVPCTIVSSDIPDDYTLPSVPESMTEDTVMDSIMPLAVCSAPKPLALLKDAIQFEHADVLFDPIIPLPSPRKVRPRLRPVPRLSSKRRLSVHGSTSESEEESRRAFLGGCGPSTSASRQRHDSHTSLSTMQALPNRGVSRVRNDSVSSIVSQAPTQSEVTSSPVKDKHVSKSRRLDSARRMAALRRCSEPIKKDTLTMYDLIYYNPSTNPIVPDEEEVNAKEANAEEARKAVKESEGKVEEISQAKGDPAPVPQIKLGPNGEIMLDEKSLVIQQSEKRTLSTGVVHEGSWSSTSAVSSYRRTPRTKYWTNAETLRFYRAFAVIGSDFMLMEYLFPGRTRRDLKLKFKREERLNPAQIDKAIRMSVEFDTTRLLNEFTAERDAEKNKEIAKAAEQQRAKEYKKEQKKKTRPAISRGSKALGTSVDPSNQTGFTANEIIQTYLETKASKKVPQKPRKRGRPKSNPMPPTATVTQDTPNTQPTDAVATTRKIDSPKPQDKIPDEPPNIPELPSNVVDGSLVLIAFDNPDSSSSKMLRTYVASGGKLTPVALSPAMMNTVVNYLNNPKSIEESPPHTSSSSEATEDAQPSSDGLSSSITQL